MLVSVTVCEKNDNTENIMRWFISVQGMSFFIIIISEEKRKKAKTIIRFDALIKKKKRNKSSAEIIDKSF